MNKTMNGGFFLKLAATNIRKNRRIYAPYIVTCVGMVMMFYIIFNLSMDEDVAAFHKGGYVQMILWLGIRVVGLFAVIFLFYTNSFLMKRRQTELGLYNVLGMGKMHVVQVLAWETVIVWTESMVLGLISGIIFSKLAQVGLIRLLGGGINYSFSINGKVAALTAVLFAGVFVLIYIKSIFDVFRMNTIDLLYGASKGEKEPKANFLLALIGILCLGGGYYIAMKVPDPISAIMLFFVAVILVIIGTYSCMISGSVTMLTALKRNKNYYYKTNHFISTSSMIFRMKKHGAGLASICILSTMVLVMISSTACLYIGAEDIKQEAYPRDIEVQIKLTGSNKQTLEKASKNLDKIIETATERVEATGIKSIKYELCQLRGNVEESRLILDSYNANSSKDIVFITAEDYNKATGNDLKLANDEVLLKCQGFNYSESTLSIGEKEYKVRGEATDLIMRGIDSADISSVMYIVVPYKETIIRLNHYIMKQSGDNVGIIPSLISYCGFNVLGTDGVQGSNDLIYEVQNAIFDAKNEMYQDVTLYGENPEFYSESFSVRTVADADEIFGLYGGLFFLGIMLSILFIVAMVLIMYYKQISEGYDDQNRFAILRKVGMANDDVKRSISYQVLTVFFVPLLGAGLHMAFAFRIIALMIRTFGIHNISLLAITTLASFGIFAVLYVAAYMITSRAYYKMVSAG